ncbi:MULTISPECIES: radical SAM family heme chaperone HemW [Rhodonellum]|nr:MULTISPECIES: radical SAM family heme chaperone HemW [Rhodonellum]
MSGIYIHIPYCKQACHYCDFHFSTNASQMQEMVDMICKELILRKNYLPSKNPIKTIYFGGGTPSLLSLAQMDQILEVIAKHYSLALKEMTLEANPDDLQPSKLLELKALGFDRLSIGIQSFDEQILKFYNRAHNAKESMHAIALAKQAGFQKLSVDLIYGFPSPDHQIWKKDLEIALGQDPGHISSYCLTVEPKTALGNWTKKGVFQPASEDFAAEQFEILQDTMDQSGYIQYEISNFAREEAFALHNTNYWKAIPYLGIGPSAHSFDGQDRGSNRAHNAHYIKNLQQNQPVFEVDSMIPMDLLNEYILTSIRTIWGTDLAYITERFDLDLLKENQKILKKLTEEGLVENLKNHLVLTRRGKLLADSIAASLFIS